MNRTLHAAVALAAIGFTGAALLLPAPLRRLLYAQADRVTDRIVTAAAQAWMEDIA